MNPGALSHLVTIQSMAGTQDPDTGVITSAWSEFAKVWAEVSPLSAREFVTAAASQSKVTATIKIRYLAGIKPSMRVVDGADVYNVEGILPDPRSGKEYITMPVSLLQTG